MLILSILSIEWLFIDLHNQGCSFFDDVMAGDLIVQWLLICDGLLTLLCLFFI